MLVPEITNKGEGAHIDDMEQAFSNILTKVFNSAAASTQGEMAYTVVSHALEEIGYDPYTILKMSGRA